jgi:molybdenum cofactor guanylyltransferase
MRHADVTLGILAGGAGSRCGGRDKGWIEVDGVAQIERMLAAYAPDAARVVISANRNLARYRALAADVVSDEWPDYPGPLAGVVGLLDAVRTAWLVMLPVDLVTRPAGLVARLRGAADAQRPVVVEDEDGVQPLVACYPRQLAGVARQSFAAGERSVRRWQAACDAQLLRLDGIRLGNRNRLD